MELLANSTPSYYKFHTQFETQYDDVHLRRYILLVWTLLVALLSISGNIIVLLASRKYHAIKLDKISKALIEHVAVADLGYTVFGVIPVLVNLAAQDASPFRAGALCAATGYTQYIFAIADIFLICALGISKLTFIRFPLRARLRSRCTARWIIGIIWVLSLLYPLENYLLLNKMPYHPITYRCCLPLADLAFKGPYWRWLAPLNVALITLTPMLVVVVSTIWLLAYVHRVNGLHRQGVVTSVLLSLVYIVSYMPFSVLALVFYYRSEDTAGEVPGLYQFVFFVLFLNVTMNPILYYFSIFSFRRWGRRVLGLPVEMASRGGSYTPSTSSSPTGRRGASSTGRRGANYHAGRTEHRSYSQKPIVNKRDFEINVVT